MEPTMTVAPNNNVMLIPEIISMIIQGLKQKDVLAASLVCTTWNYYASIVLWRHVIVPMDWYKLDLSQLYPALDRHHKIIKALKLEISDEEKKKSDYDAESIEDPLGELLSRLPNLESLKLQLPQGTTSTLVYVITQLSKNLRYLDSGHMEWIPRDIHTLFSGCPNLRRLTAHHLTGSDLQAIASAQSTFQEIRFTNPRFEEDELISFAKKVPSLTQLSVSFHQFITSKVLIGIASYCSKIEHLECHLCLGIGSDGYQALFKVSHNLRVIDIGPSEIYDEAIITLAANCPELEFLRLPYCSNVTDKGIASIVRSCSKLQVLDINWCDKVGLSIFDDKNPWVCKGLRYLDISGINANPSADECTNAQSLERMYRQLVSLKQLQNLSLSGLEFSLQLLDVGLPYLAQMQKIDTLYLLHLKDPISWEDMVTIGNLFPKLIQLEFERNDIAIPSIPPPTGTSCSTKDSSIIDSVAVKRLKTETGDVKVISADSSIAEGSTHPLILYLAGTMPLDKPHDLSSSTPKRKRSVSPPTQSSPITPAENMPAEQTLGEMESSVHTLTKDENNNTKLSATLNSGLEISISLIEDDEGSSQDMTEWRYVDSSFITSNYF